MVRQYTIHGSEPRAMPKEKTYRPSPEARQVITDLLVSNPKMSATAVINALVLLGATNTSSRIPIDSLVAPKRRGAKAKKNQNAG